MRILALRGGSDCGKTATLILVYNMVLTSGGTSTCWKKEGGDPRDFSDIIIYKGIKVAFYTMGDYSYATIDAVKNYEALRIDVLIIASNVRFAKPIKLIMKYTHNLIVKTVAKSSTIANNLVANTIDANAIFLLI